MLTSSNSIHANTAELIAEVFSCCPTIVHHQLMQHIQLRFLEEDEIFLQPGDKIEGIYLVVEGGIKLYRKKKSGIQTLHFHSPKDVIGLTYVMGSKEVNCFGSALKDSVLAFIPKVMLLKLMVSHPQSFFSLMKKLNEKAERIENLGTSIMSDSPEQTVIKAVNDLENRFGTDQKGYVKIHVPVKELAGYIGMSKTNLYRVLQTLKEKSILSHHLDKYRLEKIHVS
jgi:CRP-like cAMP-binding protein